MDHTSRSEQGQLLDSAKVTLLDIERLCELVHFIRAWWRAFEETIHQLDRAAAIKAHDAIIDSTILARQIARELGIAIPDFSGIDWTLARPSLAHTCSATDF